MYPQVRIRFDEPEVAAEAGSQLSTHIAEADVPEQEAASAIANVRKLSTHIKEIDEMLADKKPVPKKQMKAGWARMMHETEPTASAGKPGTSGYTAMHMIEK